MWELRWILLGLGVLVVAGIYFWPRLSEKLRPTIEPDEAASEATDPEPAEPAQTPSESPAEEEREKPDPAPAPRKVVTLRFVPKNSDEMSAEEAVLALRKAGLQHGRYGIFHYLPERDSSESDFSVASLLEPGSFDLANLKDATLPGMSFFMVLPGSGDPVIRFDRMVETARALTRSLDAELLDEQGSSWSIQRERYLREEIIAYRHQRDRA